MNSIDAKALMVIHAVGHKVSIDQIHELEMFDHVSGKNLVRDGYAKVIDQSGKKWYCVAPFGMSVMDKIEGIFTLLD